MWDLGDSASMVHTVWRAAVCKTLSLHASVFIQKDVGRQLEHMLVVCVFMLRGEEAGAGEKHVQTWQGADTQQGWLVS